MIRASEVFKHFRSDPRGCLADLREALDRGLAGKPGGLKPEEFSLTDLAAHFIVADGEPIGYEGLRLWASSGRFLEAAPVSASAFAAITQRIVNAAVLEGYQLPDTVLSRSVPTISGKTRDARIVNFTVPLAEGKTLTYEEGQDKPTVGLYAEYVKTLPVRKKGLVIPITREAVLADDTGGVLDAARRAGQVISMEKEALLTQFVCGLVANCVIEKRKSDAAEVTSNLFLTTGRWVNQQTNAMADWTDFDDAENRILGNTLPGTERPPMLMQRFVLVPPQLRSTVLRIINATEVRSSSVSIPDFPPNVVASANPLAGLGIQPIVSPLVYSEQVAAGVGTSVAAGTWFYGDLSQAVRYYELWPLEVVEVRDDRAAARADILVEFAAGECGVPVIVEPRVWTKNTPS